jgi:predicted amidohydrolase
MKKAIVTSISVLALSLGLCLRANAEMAREGAGSGTINWSGTFKTLPMGTERLEMHYDVTGSYTGEGPLNNSSCHCLGALHAIKGVFDNDSGFIVCTTPTGDKAFATYKRSGKLGAPTEGTIEFVGGTGKLTGIEGKGTFTSTVRSVAEGTIRSDTSISIHWKLPADKPVQEIKEAREADISSKTKRTIRVAAIQMEGEIGDVDANLASAERLVRGAFEKGAEMVILPEFFTSAMAYNPKMLEAVCPIDGKPMQLLKSLAKEYKGIVGGSFIALRDENAYNSFVLAFPDGNIFIHDKDYPSYEENRYYIGGQDDGILDTPVGSVGVALCMEFVRSATANRMLGKVDIVVGGSCWWTDNPYNPADSISLSILKEIPMKFARMLGVPIVHASHIGTVDHYSDSDLSTPRKRVYLGETQIVDRTGKILSRMSYEDGEGVILADVTLVEIKVSHEAIPDRFWFPEFPQRWINAWERDLIEGHKYYQEKALPYYKEKWLMK